MKVGDLVLVQPYTDEVPMPETRGIVVGVFHEGSVNKALKVRLINGDTCVRPIDEWKLLSSR
jgi:hypothetical protein